MVGASLWITLFPNFCSKNALTARVVCTIAPSICKTYFFLVATPFTAGHTTCYNISRYVSPFTLWFPSNQWMMKHLSTMPAQHMTFFSPWFLVVVLT